MRKLLTILGAVGLTATTSAAVVSCGSSQKDDFKAENVSMKETSFTKIDAIKEMSPKLAMEIYNTLFAKKDSDKITDSSKANDALLKLAQASADKTPNANKLEYVAYSGAKIKGNTSIDIPTTAKSWAAGTITSANASEYQIGFYNQTDAENSTDWTKGTFFYFAVKLASAQSKD